jgi:undecaprenyl-diphosphatase
MPTQPLLPRRWQPLAAVVWILSAVALAVLSVHAAGSAASDTAVSPVSGEIAVQLHDALHLLSLAAQLGSPPVVVGGSVVLSLLCALARRWRAAAFALVAAPAAGGLTEYVLKPLIHRHLIDNTLLFPSGHTTGAFALALAVTVVLLPHEGTELVPTLLRFLVIAAALTAAALVAVAVVALGWHYVTDALGGIVTAVLVVIGLAAAIDAVT